MRKLLVPIFEEGKCVYTSPSVMEIQSICTQEKATLWDENMRFVNPSNVYVDLSDNLYGDARRSLPSFLLRFYRARSHA